MTQVNKILPSTHQDSIHFSLCLRELKKPILRFLKVYQNTVETIRLYLPLPHEQRGTLSCANPVTGNPKPGRGESGSEGYYQRVGGRILVDKIFVLSGHVTHGTGGHKEVYGDVINHRLRKITSNVSIEFLPFQRPSGLRCSDRTHSTISRVSSW